MLKHSVFLDRDGVINRDSPDYIKSWAEFEFIPGSLDAIRDLTRAGCPIFIISNQSAVGRKYMDQAELDRITQNMARRILEHSGRLTDIFYCPHQPADHCACRKPKPGLIFKACERYGIDLSTAVMVGDSPKDIQCARNAGCGAAVLVKTGCHKIDPEALRQNNHQPDYIAADLREAAAWIIQRLPDNSFSL
ncbi:MAG: D-glycero-beta-D-manno-heptose 1,7-bisphosphate 7-phosphatase [Desulfobacterales bacterium]|nr:D-glycero-beta-D-manno-heptose 1,7-bisphosphate 7-phosphatase [Desulfobacterales bacterium]